MSELGIQDPIYHLHHLDLHHPEDKKNNNNL